MSLITIKRFFLDLKDDILDFVYPQTCPICRNPLKREEKDVCDDCWKALALLPSPYCPYCKSFLEDEHEITNHQCAYLSKPKDRRILAVRSLGTFDAYYKKLVHRLKYDKKIHLGRRLAQRLGETISEEKDFSNCDVVIPVPLHRARQRERGFNQSEVLAEGISRATGLPLARDILKRNRRRDDHRSDPKRVCPDAARGRRNQGFCRNARRGGGLKQIGLSSDGPLVVSGSAHGLPRVPPDTLRNFQVTPAQAGKV
jgi:predicted amidophosphoribosyltransferase